MSDSPGHSLHPEHSEHALGPERPKHHVQSLARGLAVIRTFDAEHPSRTLSDVARATGLTRAAARRFLLTLADLGYVRSDGRAFSLTPRVLELGYAYLSGQTLPELAQPHLERLSAEVGESSSVSVLDGRDVVYIARVATSRIMTVAITVGTHFPAYVTSMGRVLLAGQSAEALDRYFTETPLERFTDRTRTDPTALRRVIAEAGRRGWALVDQELEQGLRSIAVPIRDASGATIAATNVSAHSSRRTLEDVRTTLLPPLQRAAAAIEADLRMDGHPGAATPTTTGSVVEAHRVPARVVVP